MLIKVIIIPFRSSSVMLCTSVDDPSSSWTLPELDMFSLDSVNQMALDWASGNWYFLDDSREMILLCSLRNGTQARRNSAGPLFN